MMSLWLKRRRSMGFMLRSSESSLSLVQVSMDSAPGGVWVVPVLWVSGSVLGGLWCPNMWMKMLCIAAIYRRCISFFCIGSDIFARHVKLSVVFNHHGNNPR